MGFIMRIFLGLIPLLLIGFLFACDKKSGGGVIVPDPPPPDPPPPVIKPQVDPPISKTIGFFLDEWQPKTFTGVASFNNVTPPSTASVTVSIDRSLVLTKVPVSIFGTNANLWMTQMVTQPSLMESITNLKPNIIRFPGGSISDVFFWNAQPNSPPVDAPTHLLNASGTSAAAGFWYGKNSADWTLSVDNYYKLLQQTTSKGIITINYGYARYGTGANPVAAAAHLAADWVRYDNGRTKYWEIGNENFGDWEAGYRIKTADNKDGQPEYVTGQLYGQHFKVFADSMRKAATEVGATIFIGAVLYDAVPESWATNTTKTWNTGLLPAAGSSPDFYAVHNYYTNFHTNANATEILATPEAVTKRMGDYVKGAVTASGQTQKPIALDEFNIFSIGSKQQVSHINGMHAVMVLGESLKNNFGLTARWDLANGWDNGNDHGMFSQGDEPDGIPKWNPRPAFYHMYFMQRFFGDRLVASSSTDADVVSYATSFTSGEMGVVLVNKSATAKVVEVKVNNFSMGSRFLWYTLTGSNDNGEFSRKTIINGVGPTLAAGGPANYKTVPANAAQTASGIRIDVPARSAIYMSIEKK
jgi:hypothetical protein